ncbi:MAG: choice-of-anchor H family protein [Gammaproteobacteria bacterium]
MRILKPLFTLYLFFACTAMAYAQVDTQLSRSAGKLVEDSSIDLASEVKLREPVESPAAVQNSTGDALTGQDSQGQATIANRHDQYFSIYEADVSLLSDLDFDGYHHAFNVRFDVDVSYESATVYAKLYLSRDGEPWRQYHTTALFNIYGDDFSDAYEVTTELIDGYPPGYYRILIEVYSLNHAGIVASALLDHYYLGRDVMLEDLSRDHSDGYYLEEVSISHGGVGSFSMVWLLMIFQVVIAVRGVFENINCYTLAALCRIFNFGRREKTKTCE